MVLIFAGFGAHRGETLGGMDVTDEGYALDRRGRAMAADLRALMGHATE